MSLINTIEVHVTFLLYDGMTALDAVGPHEVLARIPSVVINRVALSAGPVNTDSGLVLTAEHAICDVSETDVLIVPGSGHATTCCQHPHLLDWITAIHQKTCWTSSVCTGSLILGAAGCLKGVQATTHWAALERLKRWGALPVHDRVVVDGKLITAAGVSAGIDMALTLAKEIAGEPVAKALQLGIEYDPAPPFDSGSPDQAEPDVLDRVQTKLLADFEDESDLWVQARMQQVC